MFVTLALFKLVKTTKKRIPGNLFRGKCRLVKKVTALHLDEVKRDLDNERRNMFYLRNPYLLAKEFDSVPIEEKRHDIKLFEKSRQKRYERFMKFQEPRRLQYFLNSTLGNSEKWE